MPCKKISILVYYNSMNASGGVERVIANLTREWVKKYDVTILVKDNGISFYPLPKEVRVDTLSIDCKMDMQSRLSRCIAVARGYISSKKKLKNYLCCHHSDWIYTATPMQCFEVVTAGYADRVLASEHASANAYNTIYQFIKNIAYSKAHRVIAPTKVDYQIYSNKGYHAVYIPHMTTFCGVKLGEREKRTFLNVGRLTADKQQLLLLKVWNAFQKKHSANQWELIVVGEGEERSTLEKYIKHNKLMGVHLVGSTTKIEQYYSNSTFFVFTSKMEGFGMVLLEAMAYGLPCISYDCPSGPRDIICNGKNGWLVPCNNMKLLLAKMEQVVSETPEKYVGYSKQALETVQNWPTEQILAQWDDVFTKELH